MKPLCFCIWILLWVYIVKIMQYFKIPNTLFFSFRRSTVTLLFLFFSPYIVRPMFLLNHIVCTEMCGAMISLILYVIFLMHIIFNFFSLLIWLFVLGYSKVPIHFTLDLQNILIVWYCFDMIKESIVEFLFIEHNLSLT